MVVIHDVEYGRVPTVFCLLLHHIELLVPKRGKLTVTAFRQPLAVVEISASDEVFFIFYET